MTPPPPPPAEGGIGSLWLWGESQFSQRVWPLVGGPHSSRWPHIREYMDSTNWNLRTIKTTEITKLGMGVDVLGVRGDLDFGGGVNVINIHHMHVGNSQKLIYF